MPSPAPAKVCIRCATDVAAKPRVKDDRGRYLCRPCFDAVAGERADPRRRAHDPGHEPVRIAGLHADTPPAPAPAQPPDDNALIFDLAPSPGSVAQGGGPCPTCGQYLPRDVKLCVNCGYNTATGATLGTRVAVEKVKATRESGRDSHLEQVSREVHRRAYINAISTLVIGLVGMLIAIGSLTDNFGAYAQFYGLTLAICIPASFLAFLLFALFGAAGGAGFLLILLEIAAICAAFMPIFVITTLFPLPRTARWAARALILGGLSAWLLDMDEPNNYIFAGVVFALMIGSMYGAAALMGAQVL